MIADAYHIVTLQVLEDWLQGDIMADFRQETVCDVLVFIMEVS